MKPLSPILLLTAAQAVVLPRPRTRDRQLCSLHFVMAVGRQSHRAETWAETSWPLEGVLTVDELLEVAANQGMVRDEPAPGDLVVFRPSRGRRVAIVQRVLAGGVGVAPGRSLRCRVVVAEAGKRATRIRFEEQWCSTPCGDVFVRWFEARPGVPMHSRRAA